MPNLDFDNHDTLYATHGLHAFAAKLPPQLARYALRYYSKPGELLLDPMVGSGTALVEACMMGRNALGYDIDPLARLIAQTKSTVLEDEEIGEAQKLVLESAVRDCDTLEVDGRRASLDIRTRAIAPDFINRDYWFDPEILTALSILAHHISSVEMSRDVRNFLWVSFSSLILARTSVANARDIIHSRHHYWRNPRRPQVLSQFESRMQKMRKQMAEYRLCCEAVDKIGKATVCVGDARFLDVSNESIDVVFTSPPYVTALDYPRAHFLAIPWMQSVLGVDLPSYLANGTKYIGSERGRFENAFALDSNLLELEQASSIVLQLAEVSQRQAKLCQRYFVDMFATFGEIHRVLKPHRHAIVVICPSHIRRISVPTHDIFVQMGQRLGLRLKYQHVRTISERRRVMPYISSFGTRMSTEYVLVFQKR